MIFGGSSASALSPGSVQQQAAPSDRTRARTEPLLTRDEPVGGRGGVDRRLIALFVLVAAGHAVGAALADRLNHLTSSGESFFPAAGVTLAVLLLVPRRHWWVVLTATFASEFVADLVTGEAMLTAVGSALANTVEPVVGAALIMRWIGLPRLNRRADLVVYVLAGAAVGPFVGAILGAAATRFTDPHAGLVGVVARWWTGHALGVLVIGSLLLAWLTDTAVAVRPRYARWEGSLLAVTFAVTSWLAFWQWSPAVAVRYLALVPVGWSAVRFGARGTTAVAAATALVGEWAAATNHGVFHVITGHQHQTALWFLQLFLAVAILGGLLMAAAVAETGRAEAALRVSERAEQVAVRDAQLAERTRLARELHDSVSQALFSMTLHARAAQLAVADAGLAESSPPARAIERLRSLTAGALAEMRTLIFELRPGALAEEGLVSALRRQATAVSAREGVQISVDGPDISLNLPADAEEHCYRLILEMWNNTIKHASAQTIRTTISRDCGFLTATAVDDGCGFDTSTMRPGHLGLRMMRERTEAIGAALEILSGGGGTTVRISFPHPSPEATADLAVPDTLDRESV
jgi:signal transduction histidine kinase